jgi:hypothetical protein
VLIKNSRAQEEWNGRPDIAESYRDMPHQPQYCLVIWADNVYTHCFLPLVTVRYKPTPCSVALSSWSNVTEDWANLQVCDRALMESYQPFNKFQSNSYWAESYQQHWGVNTYHISAWCLLLIVNHSRWSC